MTVNMLYDCYTFVTWHLYNWYMNVIYVLLYNSYITLSHMTVYNCYITVIYRTVI